MLTRRRFISGAALTMAACSAGTGGTSHAEAVRQTWRRFEADRSDAAKLRSELIRYATLAPSSHNTQCWKFRSEERAVIILPDLSRRCPAVDPDDHHLFVSLGCAAENLALAAGANGLHAETRFESGPEDRVQVALKPAKAAPSPLFEAIPQRQCSRSEYGGRPLSSDELRLLAQAGSGDGVRLLIVTEKPKLEGILDYVAQGNASQIADPAFVKELKSWIRFSESEAVRSGDGLFTASSGNPALPRWLGSPLFDLFFTAHSENDKYARQLRSSAGVAVFVSETADKAHWVQTGRCYERFALQATLLGIRNALINQPVEVAGLRDQFARFLSLGGQRPDLVVRFGRGPEMPRSLRRPVETVLA